MASKVEKKAEQESGLMDLFGKQQIHKKNNKISNRRQPGQAGKKLNEIDGDPLRALLLHSQHSAL
jgi:hypothetical protein